MFMMVPLRTYKVVNMVAKNSIPITKNILFGPAGFTGTEAPFSRVKAGVFSRTLACAAC